MTNKELQEYLKQYPDEIKIKLWPDHSDNEKEAIKDFEDENILFSSETAFIDDTANLWEWDHEDGKIDLGDGEKYLLINPKIY